MALFDFTEVIERRGIDPAIARVVRHDRRGVREWHLSPALFGHFASIQRADWNSPYKDAEFAFHFLPGPRLAGGEQTALFVRAHRILREWFWADDPQPFALYRADSGDQPNTGHRVYDLDPLADFDDLIERVLIDWGTGTRSWSQWASRRRKEIIELRRVPNEPDFPGFAAFASTIEEVPLLPRAWRAALASVKGVYLLVCPETGEQYVGSAYGEYGFWGRWLDYATTGHANNRLLLARRRVNYAVTILEVASPDMASADIIEREAAWKIKLGSRAHGLNAN